MVVRAKKKLSTHPWRLCPYGEHWVKTHSMKVPPSKAHPGGYDPSVNICSGIRWLFEKQRLASSYLEREATWEETIKDYKGQLRKSPKNPDSIKQMEIFNNFLKRLNNCEKN